MKKIKAGIETEFGTDTDHQHTFLETSSRIPEGIYVDKRKIQQQISLKRKMSALFQGVNQKISESALL